MDRLVRLSGPTSRPARAVRTARAHASVADDPAELFAVLDSYATPVASEA